ncbi:carboxyl transferase domain-containing protein [Aquabacterium sp.]|uniref:carboxyl transferase domain-containing protein n=1 Tax=Aquabacterium sp. TaxID=1872578 RepID=UPI003783B41A
MSLAKLLVANRGEIALRILRAAQDIGIATVAVFARDDAQAPHCTLAHEAVALQATGPAAYLDIAALVAIARQTGCDAVHPGYGFLSERADFAEACAAAGLRFVGPTPAQLALFGDKARARALAAEHGVPLLPGTGAAGLAQLQAFFAEQRAHDPQCGLMLKAVAGGGGRGMRAVSDPAQLPEAFERCSAEAQAAFGVGAVYAERLIAQARHIEVQVIGDGRQVMALGERECTLQRRFQKLVEIAPSPTLAPALRERLVQAALTLARASGYQSLGTFEFLVDEASADLPFVFIEANPRLQVEHTVTEAVTGLDLVQLQLAIAAGQPLAALGLDPAHPPAERGFAVQWRINAEQLDAQGQARPASGRITRCEFAQGPGVRVDSQARADFAPSPHYDSLLAKLIVHHGSPRFEDVLRRSQRALAECRIAGLATNLPLLRTLAAHEALPHHRVHTRWLEQQWPALQARLAAHQDDHPPLPASAASAVPPADEAVPEGLIGLRAPMAGRVVQLHAGAGQALAAAAEALVLEAMKMQHGIAVPQAVRVEALRVAAGDFVDEGQLLMLLAPADADAQQQAAAHALDLDHLRADLQRVLERSALTLDAARPEAIARRHAAGGRSARENIADLCDPGSFIEYGAYAIAAQTRRRPVDELVRQTPADGMVTGIGTVNAAHFGDQASRCAVMAYDYTVLAGTQGFRNHAKKDRLLGLIHQLKLPTVLFAEGGGGRPGDVDMPIVAGLNNHTFSQFAALSGQVPVLGIVHGRCFAGNAALLGCCDTIVATRAANIGMGGPAMIEGGGLGVFRPEEIGPAAELHANGVVDLLVDDEAAAVAAARQYLSYFQGPVQPWQADDARLLRHAVPENRVRAYDMRALLRHVADRDSVLELRAGFGAGMITALVRIEGRPMGVIANNPQHLGGAIDPEGASKAARFLQLCEAHGLPLLSLCDTPGFMVGPDIERQAQVRHACRMFLAAAKLSVPCFTVVVRKGYGLGAQAMAVGGFDAPVFTIAWPTGEFGAMGLEGAVRLGFRKELEAAAEGAEREALYQKLVAEQYRRGSAINMATTLEIDAVIDPADTRAWLLRGLDSAARKPRGSGGRFVDGW